ncbi:MAG: hypothetical protein DRN95_08420, partial [Candidatus Hydrothermarchaeota archaeon]
GDKVTLNFSSNEQVNKSMFVINIGGQSVPLSNITNTTAFNWSAFRVLDGSEPDGSLDISIEYTDMAGNEGDVETSTDDSSEVVFDNTNPTIDRVTIYTNNVRNSSYGKLGDDVELEFSFSEKLNGTIPTVMIDGNAADSVTNTPVGSVNWTAVRMFQVGDTEAQYIEFNISGYYDEMGNPGLTVTNDTTDGSWVKYDETSPIVTVNNGTEVGPLKIDSVNVTVSDINLGSSATMYYGFSVDGVCDVTDDSALVNLFNNTKPFDIEEDHQDYLCVKSLDIPGNVVYHMVGQLNTDNTAPILDIVEGAEGVPVQTETLKFNATDINLDTNMLWYGLNPDDNCTSTDNYADDMFTDETFFNISAGDKYGHLCVKAGDSAGNFVYEYAGLVHTDNTFPIISGITISSNNSVDTEFAKQGDKVTIMFEVDEDVENVVVMIDGNPADMVSNVSNNYTAYRTMQAGDTEGNITFSIDCDDIAGNAATTKTTINSGNNVEYDETLPTVTEVLDVDVGPVKMDTIQIDVNDTNLVSAFLFYGFSADNVCDVSDNITIQFNDNIAFNITGNHKDYLCVAGIDVPGNKVYHLVGQLNTDNVKPTITVPGDMIISSQTNLDATAIDVNTMSYSWTVETAPGASIVTMGTPLAEDTTFDTDTDGSYVVRLTVTDGAGNSNYSEVSIEWDTSMTDTYSLSVSPNNPVQGDDITIGAIVSDTISVRGVRVYIDGVEYANLSDSDLEDGAFGNVSEVVSYVIENISFAVGTHTVSVVGFDGAQYESVT